MQTQVSTKTMQQDLAKKIQVVNREQVGKLGTQVVVGSCFAFLKPEFFADPAFSWVGKILGRKPSSGMSIVSLLDSPTTELAGVKLFGQKFASIELSSITSDKALYKADEDSIDLLLVNPMMCGAETMVQIAVNGDAHAQHSVKLDAQGAGKLTLQDLPAGDYEVFFDGSSNIERHCKFSVAQYKMVQLVAELESKQLNTDGKLAMQVKLSSFGFPVDGMVSIEVYEGNTRRSVQQANCEHGILNFSVTLYSQGSHSLNFQLLDEPSKTASLPIIGSRLSERSQTKMNLLGNETLGSLLPSEGAFELRGIYLTEGGLSNTPLRLEYDEHCNPVLRTSAAIDSLKIVVVDPNFPRMRAGVIDVENTPDPSNFDPQYAEAAVLFERGKESAALPMFQQARAKQTNPHAFYSYFEACCHARLGDSESAIAHLKQSLIDGWVDFAHMQTDPDLESLHGHEKFEYLKSGGLQELSFDHLKAHHVIKIPQLPVLTVLCVAAVIKDQAWEGWTSYLTPSKLAVEVESESEFASGHLAELKLKVSGAEKCTAYVVVKDARFLSNDKPEARLASALKSFVEDDCNKIEIGFKTDTVAALASQVKYSHAYGSAPPPGMSGSFGAPLAGGSLQQAQFSSSDMWGASEGSFSQTPSPPSPPSQPASQAFFDAPKMNDELMPNSSSLRAKRASQAPASAPSQPAGVFGVLGGQTSAYGAPQTGAYGGGAQGGALGQQKDRIDESKNRSETEIPDQHFISQKGKEPEVLFADFVPLKDGAAVLELLLPPQECDYLLECFVISEYDWCSSEHRFRAVSDPLAEFTLPRFINAGEEAQGFLHVGTNSQAIRCNLFFNGQEVALNRNSKPFACSESISESLLNLQFAALSGVYKAVVSDLDGHALTQIEQTVDEPGKLKRRVRTIRMLRQGESIDLKSDATVVALRLLPGLDQSFKLLTSATTEYGHACCEQTAAKILAACSAYIFTDDSKQKELASSAIIAGVKREERMFLPGRGFKSYPEQPDNTDQHYGPQAARHLANLALLKNEKSNMGKELSGFVQRGLEMSADALKAYSIAFPPRQIQSTQDAYNACRFSTNGVVATALQFVRNKALDPRKFLESVPSNAQWGLAVNSRIEAAYAAASLFRGGSNADFAAALTLANHVVKAFNEQGRLYSTIDSVAAIALFSEMITSNVIGSGGTVEINGAVLNLKEALKSCENIESLRCVSGVVAVEIERIEEEDWSVFNSQMQIRVALEKNQQTQRSFKLGDQVDLRVKLEQGYKDGDLLWLCLPDCLSRVYGGGQVKLFSVDFSGKDELVIPLAVTGSTSKTGKKGQQSLALCVRNMYEEERGANPGLIGVVV